MKRKIIIFGILSAFLLYALPLHADRHGFVRKVVIDPGHGGRDPGAIGANAEEKDLVLSISLKLGGYIEENFNDVEVIYTRTTDEFIGLQRRAQIANENNADLFISMHINSVASHRPYGTETFVMGLHKSKENLAVAKKENASILYEDDYIETYDGYDPNSPEANIMFSMFQNLYLNQSLTVASLVQNQFRDRAGRKDRGVKQAGFLVLYNITMPGILVEAGFLSNPQEEKYLMSEMGQAHIASAVFRAFRDYKTYQDSLATQQLANINGNKHSLAEVHLSDADIDDTQTEENQENKSLKNNTPDISFRVQFATTTVERPLDAPEFKGIGGISFYKHDGLYKYTIGNEKTFEDAVKIQQNLHKNGFKDAFVVAFKNDLRIAPAEAMRMLNESTNP